MIIETQGQPYAGEDFVFAIADTRGIARIQAFIGGVPVLDKECPNPPCHDRIPVPPDAGGHVLRIVALDRSDSGEWDFMIVSTDTNAGGMMNTLGA